MDRKKENKKKLFSGVVLLCLLAMLSGMTVMAAGINGGTLKQNKATVYNYKKTGRDTYFKLTVPSSGAVGIVGIRFNINNSGKSLGCTMSLCNSAKKQILGSLSFNSKNGFTTYVSVKKGTYYLKTKDSYSSQYLLGVSYVFGSVADRSGNTKAKARAISKNKQTAGLLLAGEKASVTDWYKIKLTKNQKLWVNLESRGTGPVRFRFYGNKINSSKCVYNITNGQKKGYLGSGGKAMVLKAGTYYIQVSRAITSKATSGFYKITWK